MDHGIRLIVAAPNRAARRPIEVTGLADLLYLAAELGDALDSPVV